MYAWKNFTERKTSFNIQQSIDNILMELTSNPDNIPVTTDKGANIVAAMNKKITIRLFLPSIK